VTAMNGDQQYPIGEVARRTGLSVKAIRYYADTGVVTPSGRTPAGYRLFSAADVARLDLVRTLRDLGIDLPTARRVSDREIALPEVAAAHAEALTAQIRLLRLRRAVLRTVAKLGDTLQERDLMHQLARLSDDERRRVIDEFFDATFRGLDTAPGILRSLTPHLPDDPTTAQAEAWVELAILSRDPGFRAAARSLAERYASERPPGLRPDGVALVRDIAGFAASARLDPTSPECDDLVATVMGEYATAVGRPDGPALRTELAAALDRANDPRWQRYLELVSVINGWPHDSSRPVLDWFRRALAARL
jgi:DNA-binding transcriptional MerR regulator